MTAAKFTQEYFRQQGARGGKKGGKARMQKLTPAERSALGRAAAAAKKLKNGAPPKSTALSEPSTTKRKHGPNKKGAKSVA